MEASGNELSERKKWIRDEKWIREVGGQSLIEYIYNLIHHQGKTPDQVGHSVRAVLKLQRNWDTPNTFICAVVDVAKRALAEEVA